MGMDDRPNASIWGTVLSITEIGLNIYKIAAENGRGIMIAEDEAEKALSDNAAAQGEHADGYVHYAENSPGAQAAASELIKSGRITDPEVIDQYGTPVTIEAKEAFISEYFKALPEPGSIPEAWGAQKESTPMGEGVYFLACEHGGGIAVHENVAYTVMSDYSRVEDYVTQGDYRYYGLNKGAAIAIHELSASYPKAFDLITSWESLMHTLAAEFPAYTAYWNSNSSPDKMITDVPAPPFMFLQRHLDEAAARPAKGQEYEGEPGEYDIDEDEFYEHIPWLELDSAEERCLGDIEC